MQLNKKNVINSALFLLGLVMLLALLSVCFRPKDNREHNGMEDIRANGILSEPEETMDVMFIGDSISYVSVMPMQIWRDYGITSYLCGSPEQRLYYTKEFFVKALERQSPKIIFLETATIFNHFSDKDKIWNVLEQIFPILRYHDRWKTFAEWPEWEEGFQVEYTYPNYEKGYYYSKGIDGTDASGYVFKTDEYEWIPDINRETLFEIKELCDEHGAELVLLSEPNVMGSWTPIRHTMSAMLAEWMGVEYIDINYMQEEVPIDWKTDTFDKGDHLNYYGAQKVTAYLGKYLSERGIFEDKRENPDYAFWNEQLKDFYRDKPHQ